MKSKEDLIELKKHYEKLLLTAIEVYHRLPYTFKKDYDEMIKDYIAELKELNRKIMERV